ncbi:hypothetical protein [Rufibacter aurantiacus]
MFVLLKGSWWRTAVVLTK